MKFLVNKFFIYLISLPSLVFTYDCIESFHKSTINDNSNIILKYTFDMIVDVEEQSNKLESVNLFIDLMNEKIRLDYSNQILLFDEHSSMSLFKDTNQLFIEEPDTSPSYFIKNFMNIKSFMSNLEYLNKQYILNEYLGYDKIILELNQDCSQIIFLQMNNYCFEFI